MLYPQHDAVSKVYPSLPAKDNELVDCISVARVRPRTSKGITDLLLPKTSFGFEPIVSLRRQQSRSSTPTKKLTCLFSRIRSRSLSELTRQITPRTKNGHAPPPIESRKSFQSVNPHYVWTWWVSPCWVKLSRRLHSWWCPSVNSFKFQSCVPYSPQSPNTLLSLRFRVSHRANPIPSRHSLWLGLRRYLIVFDPLTLDLDQRKRPG